MNSRRYQRKKTFGLDTIRQVDPLHPEPDVIAEAAKIIERGGIVAFPARCLYGLAADAFNEQAVSRIFEIKQRPADKAILVLIKNREELGRLVKRIPPAAVSIMDHFWPGKITIIFEAGEALPLNLTAGSGKIGVRMAGHPVSAALVKQLKNPITGTSANLSAEKGCRRISEMNPEVASKLDLILDAGTLKGGIGSTIIDVTVDPPRILRQGEVSEKEIFDIL